MSTTLVKLIQANMSLVSTDVVDRVPNHKGGTCMTDREVCGRGPQQINRSVLSTDGIPFAVTHAPMSCLSDTCNNAVCFLILTKEQRQCCRQGPYAALINIHKSAVHPSWEILADRTGVRSPRINFSLIVWDTTD